MNNSDLFYLICRRKPLFHASFPFVIFWTPKAGCTSITKWFFYQVGLLDEALAFSPWVHHYRTRVFQSRGGYLEECFMALAGGEKPAIKLVRDPFIRAVSGYLSIVQLMNNPSDKWIERVLPKLNDALGHGKIFQALSFRQFVSALVKTGVAPSDINEHLARQFEEHEQNYLTKHVKLEEFGRSIRDIELQFNLKDSPLERLTSSRHHRVKIETPSGRLVADLPGIPRSFPRLRTPSYDCFYDHQLRDLTYHVYKQDFEAYDYSSAVSAQ